MKHKFNTAVVTAGTIQAGDSISSLVTKAIQLADLDGSLNRRLYEL